MNLTPGGSGILSAPSSQQTKRSYVRKAIGGESATLGVMALECSDSDDSPTFIREQQTDYLFFWIIVPLMAIPGALAVAFGVELFREKSTTALKWVGGLLAALEFFG